MKTVGQAPNYQPLKAKSAPRKPLMAKSAPRKPLMAKSPNYQPSPNQAPTHRTFAPILVILAACLWGILVVFVRAFGKADFTSMEIVTLRVYSSAIFLWIFLFLFDRKNIKFHIKDSWCFVGTGLVSIVFFSYCYFRNVEVSSAAVAGILMYTSPIFVTFLSAIFFHEKITKIKVIALFLAILGCALVSGVVGGISNVSALGVFLGLGSGIGYALYSIFGRFALDKGYAPLLVTAMTFTFACVGVLPFIHIANLCSKLAADPKYILLALIMGLVGSCTPFALYTIGLRYMEASKAAILATLEPIVTALVGTFLYKEPIDIFIIMGIIMVLIAGILSSRKA